LLLVSISLISAAALGYEVLLTRLFSIIHWHHFAYMIISLALLGYGASGTFLTLAGPWLQSRFRSVFAANAGLFGIAMVLCFGLAQRVPFNALEVPWDPHQQLYLLALYLLLFIPFFCAASCVGLAFSRYRHDIARIYRADLFGAGVGAAAVVALLFLLSPSDGLLLLGTVALIAAALVLPRRPAVAVLLGALLVPVAVPHSWLALQISEYKGLPQMLQIMGMETVSEHSSPLGLLTVVRSTTVPFRHAPGLSLNSRHEPPSQLGVFTDGDALTVINRYDGRREPLAYLDDTTPALPYHLLARPRVLVLGAGGGSDVLLARYHSAPSIDAVELNPQMVDLVRRRYADFAGHLYQADGVHVHTAEARGFVAATKERYDVIQIALLDSYSAASAGVHALHESYLYTIEALGEYLGHLTPGGMLAITRWVKLPPRDNLKLFATAVAALRANGVADPGNRLALIRGWQTATLLVKNGEFSAADIAAIQAFCEARAFDTAFFPGMAPAQANRFNILDQPYLYEGALALLGKDSKDYTARYKFDIAPATDDRPYFFHFFKWRALPELLTLSNRSGFALVEWGYLILFATLLQATLASLLLIILPLWTLRRQPPAPIAKGRVYGYFFGLGLAFLFIEIAFIQKFILFLSHPLYAIAAVLCAFLVFAGLGSGYSRRLAQRPRAGGWSPITVAVAAIIAIALLYLFMLPLIFHQFMALSDAAKIAISLVLIGPLAFFMGMPFPLGLGYLADRAPQFIPWAWGINGCASVISAILATILAIHLGFTAVVLLALALYLLSALTLR